MIDINARIYYFCTLKKQYITHFHNAVNCPTLAKLYFKISNNLSLLFNTKFKTDQFYKFGVYMLTF